jgi:uncharacterized protein YgiM (DUF1202 family)
MKKLCLIVLLFTAYCLYSCKSGSSGSNSLGVSASDAVCVWDNVSLKEAPTESSKWLSSISIGEKVTYLEETKDDTAGKKSVTYYKIKLKDDKTGWALSDFIIVGSKPAVISKDVELYSRPDLLTKTGKMFKAMDIIAVKSEQNDFLEISGKRQEGKWIEAGWIKSNGISYSDIDIAVAKYARKALEIKDSKKRADAIKEIVNNPDFSGSIFISTLQTPEPETTEPIKDTVPGVD